MNKDDPNTHYTPWQLIPSWLTKSQSDYWMVKLQNSLNWYRPIVTLYGKKHIVPRMSFFLADSDISYTYSGVRHFGEGWPEWFRPLLEQVRSTSHVHFNGCLLNFYSFLCLFKNMLNIFHVVQKLQKTMCTIIFPSRVC